MWRFLNKLRNASRFVMTKHFGEDASLQLSYEDLFQDINDHQELLNPYDTRVLGKLSEKSIQIQKYIDKYMLGEALQEIIDFTWGDFCDRYIEISKKQASNYTPKVLLYLLGTLYKYLHPYMPFATESLWKHIGFEGILMQTSRPHVLQMKQKNYRINLLMDMIGIWRTLKGQMNQKSHEKVRLFVQANKDILDQVLEQETLIKDILNVESIQYYSNGQEIEGSYSTDMLMDIKL